MGGRDEDMIGGNAGLCGGLGFDFIEEHSSHHTGVDDDGHDAFVSVGECECASFYGCFDFSDGSAEHASVDEDGKCGGRDIDDGGTGLELGAEGFGAGCERDERAEKS